MKRTVTHLTFVNRHSQSLRTVVPRHIAEQWKLEQTDMLEWFQKGGDIVVKKLKVK